MHRLAAPVARTKIARTTKSRLIRVPFVQALGSITKDFSPGPGATGKSPFYSCGCYICLTSSRGCTTPLVLQNIKESIGGEGEDEDSLDFDALDGFDEVPLEMQEKIKTALVKGHVEDEEWNGVSTG